MKVLERNVKIRKTSLKEETNDLENTTPGERWAMMWQLALDDWAFKENPLLNPDFRNILSAFIEEKVEVLEVGC